MPDVSSAIGFYQIGFSPIDGDGVPPSAIATFAIGLSPVGRVLLAPSPPSSDSAIGAFIAGASPIPGVPRPATLPGIPFFVIEVTIYKASDRPLWRDAPHGARPHGALVQVGAAQRTDTLFASDVGYRSRAADPQGVVAYPPVLNQAFQIDTALNLDPAQSSVAASWGSVLLWNTARQFDEIVVDWNADGRPVRVLYGEKIFDATRHYWNDPPYSSLVSVFAGQATPWYLSDTALTIPLRDATYWLDRPYQTRTYKGTGGYEGSATLTGHPLPRTRGGTSSDPVRNVTPTLIDPVNLIYQYNDAAGTVVHLYEGAASVINFNADTTNLYSGSTPAGHYRTDNSRGMFQLGSSPVHAITADVTGQFPSSGVVNIWADIARCMLLEDILLPTANLNTAAFTAAATDYPYEAGIYFGSDSNADGIAAINAMMSGIGAKLVPDADGMLRPFVLRTAGTPVATFNLANIIGIVPQQLPAPVAPPPKRYRVGYCTNYTVQTSDLNTASASADQLQFVAQTSKVAISAGSVRAFSYSRPNDPPVIPGALLKEADALAVANDMMALFGVRRRLYDVTVPVVLARELDLGDTVTIKYPTDDLDAGHDGQIVRRRFTMGDAATTFQVLL